MNDLKLSQTDLIVNNDNIIRNEALSALETLGFSKTLLKPDNYQKIQMLLLNNLLKLAEEILILIYTEK